MTILDTNVLSALMHVVPERNVVAWLDRQPRTSIWTTSITVLEIRFGLQTMPGGKRRSALIQSFQELLGMIDHRVVPFDVAAAEQAGDLMASRHRKGRPGNLRDTMIAGIAMAQHATLATRNIAHFEDIPVPLVDPWAS
jgi:predicted nucleic acid-binding protein